MSTAVLQALAREPWGLGRRELRARLSLIGGDGAAVRGGADRKKPGTRCAEHMWAHLHPPHEGDEDEMFVGDIDVAMGRRIDRCLADGALHFCTEWDKFDREDIALHRAIRRSAQAEEMYAVTAAMDHMFHMGDGRLLLKSAANAVGIQSRSGWMPSLTRKAVGLASEPGILLSPTLLPMRPAFMHSVSGSGTAMGRTLWASWLTWGGAWFLWTSPPSP